MFVHACKRETLYEMGRWIMKAEESIVGLSPYPGVGTNFLFTNERDVLRLGEEEEG
jgi:hypothetical protein